MSFLAGFLTFLVVSSVLAVAAAAVLRRVFDRWVSRLP